MPKKRSAQKKADYAGKKMTGQAGKTARKVMSNRKTKAKRLGSIMKQMGK